MRVSLPNSPRRVATLTRPGFVHLRVISGDCLLSDTNDNLIGGGGLPVGVSDGIQSILWPGEELWLMGNQTAVVEVITP
jgi:hypothetical protein